MDLLLVVSVFVNLLFKSVFCFNVDVAHVSLVSSSSSAGGLFGYSVVLTDRKDLPVLLVGEPKANWPNQPSIRQPGDLHICSLHLSRPYPNIFSCSRGDFDQTGNVETYINGVHVWHLKNEAMFASSIAASSSGMAIFCGPGWKNQLGNPHYLMNGLCYALDLRNRRNVVSYAPLSEHRKQGNPVSFNKTEFYYAFGQAGFSISLCENELLLGGPGVGNWRGTVVRYRIENGVLKDPIIPDPNRMQIQLKEGYFGYSVTAASFFPGRKGRVQYAAGAPRADLLGKVLVFELPDRGHDSTLAIIQDLPGHQVGEYFGATLAAEDVTGDGLVDLLVGAPLHSTASAGDAGRVYLYINRGDGRLQESSEVYMGARGGGNGGGGAPGARFGYAISSVGDIDRDGYNDIAVGAPYEDEGRGAVYVLHGGPQGLKPPFAQRIAAQVVAPTLRSWGSSISSGLDVDRNGYNDFAVGAPLADTAAVLRSRPVARITSTLTSLVRELPLSAVSFTVSVCFGYSAFRAMPDVELSVRIWVEGVTERTQLYLTETAMGAMGMGHKLGLASQRQLQYKQTIHLDRTTCRNVSVDIRASAQDFSTPIDVSMNISLINVESSVRSFCPSCPVLHPQDSQPSSLRIPFANGCEASQCRPDLSVTAFWTNVSSPLILGQARELSLLVEVANQGDSAFAAALLVDFPRPLALSRLPGACRHDGDGELDGISSKSFRLYCFLANPLNRQSRVLLTLQFELWALTVNMLPRLPKIEIGLNASSAGAEANLGDNVLNVELPLSAQVVVSVKGKASPDLGLLPDDIDDKVINFTHTYEVVNVGLTGVDFSFIRLHIPTRVMHGSVQETLLATQVYVDRRKVLCSKTLPGIGLYVAGTPKDGEADFFNKAKAGLIQPDHDEVSYESGAGRPNPTLGGKIVHLRCGLSSVSCEDLECPLGALPGRGSGGGGAGVTVAVRSSLSTAALRRALGLVGLQPVSLSTSANVYLPVSELALPAGSVVKPGSLELSTLLLPPSPPPGVQPHIIWLSVFVGLIVLLLLTFGLHKVGFFIRKQKKKPGTTSETPASGSTGADDAILLSKNSSVNGTNSEINIESGN